MEITFLDGRAVFRVQFRPRHNATSRHAESLYTRSWQHRRTARIHKTLQASFLLDKPVDDTEMRESLRGSWCQTRATHSHCSTFRDSASPHSGFGTYFVVWFLIRESLHIKIGEKVANVNNRPQVFPPSFQELAPPALELFDLDEAFSSDLLKLSQLTNKYVTSKESTSETEIDYYIREFGEIIRFNSSDGANTINNSRQVLNHVFEKLTNYKAIHGWWPRYSRLYYIESNTNCIIVTNNHQYFLSINDIITFLQNNIRPVSSVCGQYSSSLYSGIGKLWLPKIPIAYNLSKT